MQQKLGKKVPETLTCKNACLTKGLMRASAQKNGSD
jgi:hypothetical protein